MTQSERDAFLADSRVAVLAVADPPRGPLAIPIWYDRLPSGEFWIFTPAASPKAKLIAKAGRLSFVVQDERPPYRYVSVEGPVTAIEPAQLEQIRHLARRYYGPEKGDDFAEELRDEVGASTRVRIRMQPERWRTADYSKH
jgi:PPOX class probable F420-dependent enzyme